MSEEQFPLQRWPGVLQPDTRLVLQLGVPPPPTSAANDLRSRLAEGGEQAQASPALLKRVIGLLQPVEVKSM